MKINEIVSHIHEVLGNREKSKIQIQGGGIYGGNHRIDFREDGVPYTLTLEINKDHIMEENSLDGVEEELTIWKVEDSKKKELIDNLKNIDMYPGAQSEAMLLLLKYIGDDELEKACGYFLGRT